MQVIAQRDDRIDQLQYQIADKDDQMDQTKMQTEFQIKIKSLQVELH